MLLCAFRAEIPHRAVAHFDEFPADRLSVIEEFFLVLECDGFDLIAVVAGQSVLCVRHGFSVFDGLFFLFSYSIFIFFRCVLFHSY